MLIFAFSSPSLVIIPAIIYAIALAPALIWLLITFGLPQYKQASTSQRRNLFGLLLMNIFVGVLSSRLAETFYLAWLFVMLSLQMLFWVHKLIQAEKSSKRSRHLLVLTLTKWALAGLVILATYLVVFIHMESA